MRRYRWAAPGDVSAFFGLMLDNIADLVLFVSLLTAAFQFDATFAIRYMIPGTALGVLVGDALFTALAFWLAKSTGRDDVTAMPLGLDTPSTIGMVLFVVGPAYLDALKAGFVTDDACRKAWQIGMSALIVSGVFKLACATASTWIRRHIPRAGLLGSLTAIALVLISFLPLLHLTATAVVGFVALAIILTALVARVPLPGRFPGALAGAIVGSAMFYAMQGLGLLSPHGGAPFEPHLALTLPWPTLAWTESFVESLKYLPVVIPFALATVVGGLDCTESAAVAGDEYPTGVVVGIEAIATLVAGLCGGVIQTTPYIGHPAYRAMGGRAGYTLATALFIGGAGMCGFFAHIYAWLPQAAVLPILIFIGLEITSQCFRHTPSRHLAAVAFGCLPAMAYLVMMFADNLVGITGKTLDELPPPLGEQLQALRTLSGGFIVTSLLWASALAAMIDRKLLRAAGFWLIAAVCTLFGVMHSPLPGSPMFLPWRELPLPHVARGQTPVELALAYALAAVVLAGWGLWLRNSPHAVAEHDE